MDQDSCLNTQLLTAMLDQHAAALELYAAQWTTMPADCVQEAFIALVKERRLPEHPAAWLYQVVRNKALNKARSERRRQHHETIAANLIDRKPSNETVASELPLLESLDALPVADRELVVLRIWSGLTWKEIAAVTDTSSSSAQRRYVAALAQLRKHLEPSCRTK